MKKYLLKGVLILLSVYIISCSSNDNYVPKPHAYPKLALPPKRYFQFESKDCPFSFQIPRYSIMLPDENSKGKHWYNLHFPTLNATLHFTYYEFKNWKDFDTLVSDSRSLVNKHLQRAEDILEEPVTNLNPKVPGLIFHIQGNTATNLNFFTTDSSKHFLRGALYFNKQTQADSIYPVFKFLEQDVNEILKTFVWKK
jgi:gliding motility-associated lipoprotein GldD